jgi:hypothetical protein
MKNHSVVSFAIGCLILSACATTNVPDATTTPVKVTVTGNSDISPAFARDVEDAALQAIKHYAPHARPMSVSLVLNGTTSGVTVVPGTTSEPQFRTLGTAGASAAEQGALPVVPVYPSSVAGQISQSYVQLRGTYAISDADGRVIESKPLEVGANANYGRGEIETRRDLILRAGEAVAFRVKALSH